MSQLLHFTSFLKDRQYALNDFEEFTEIIEPITDDDGRQGYRLKPLQRADKITQRCKVLVYYTWHCRDYVKRILSENGVSSDPGQIINTYIQTSGQIQIISYLANEYKHAGVDVSQRWATEIEPRYGKPFVRGILESFPHRLKPTVQLWGESIPEFEFSGYAGMGESTFTFEDFVWTFSCNIENKHGVVVGHALAMCESAFQTWLKILRDNGVEV